MSKPKDDTPNGPLQYDGGDQGLFIVGVPARNLSAEEAKRYWPLIKAVQDEGGVRLYKAVTAAESPDIVTSIQPDNK